MLGRYIVRFSLTLIHSFTQAHTLARTYLLTDPPTHTLAHIYPLTHSPTHSLTHSLSHSFTHSLTLSPTHPPTHSHTHTHSPTHPLTRALLSLPLLIPSPEVSRVLTGVNKMGLYVFDIQKDAVSVHQPLARVLAGE